MGDIHVGDLVEVTTSKLSGTVRYVGTTSFADGEWVGVELDSPTGKNDGSVAGKRYFSCKPNHGMFVRKSSTVLVKRPKPTSTERTSVNGVSKPVRPSSGVVADPSKKRQSIASVPSTGSRLSMRSPTKSPTKQLPSTTSSTRPTLRTSIAPGSRPTQTNGAKPRPSVGVRQSMGPPAGYGKESPAPQRSSTTMLKTLTTVARRSASTQRSSEERASQDVTDNSELTSNLSEEAISSPAAEHLEGSSAEEDVDAAQISPLKSTNAPMDRPNKTEPVKASQKTASPRPKPATSTPASRAAETRKIEQLEAHVRMIEKKRMEDRKKIKELEQIKEERDRFEAVIQKLQARYQPQQQELTELKKQLVEAQAKVDEVERKEAEKDSEIEMATLDREMAEEMSEAYKAEVDALRLKTQDLELEIQVLQEENNLFNEETPVDDASRQSLYHLERENARVKDALLRLRDLTQDNEEELKSQIKELQTDLRGFDAFKKDHEATQEDLQKAKQTIVDLQEQLDAAEDQEDVIENLTETNSRLQSDIENLRALILDLEDMQAINDELEQDHQVTERELQTELDYRESLLLDLRRDFSDQSRVIGDMEFMVDKYKETLAAFHKEFDNLRESRQISETEAASFDERSRAVMDLQLKLQTSENKAQTKLIDMQLQKLKAEECEQHLAILQNFIVDSFERDRIPIEALLRFKRIAFKALTMEAVLRDRGASSTSKDATDSLLNFEIEEKLEWINGACTRFLTFASHCTVAEFTALGQAFYEVEALERSMNVWIDALRSNELDRKHCATELNNHRAILVDLIEKFIPSTLATEADALHCQTLVVESCLETVTAVLPMLKDLIAGIAVPEGNDMDTSAEFGLFSRKVQDFEFQTRSTKVVAGKVARALEEMIQRSDSFVGASSEMFEAAENLAQDLSTVARATMRDVQAIVMDENLQELPRHQELMHVINKAAREGLHLEHEIDAFTALTEALGELQSRLNELSSSVTDITKTTEFERGPAPWTIRARELKANREHSAETEDMLRRLQTDVQAKSEVLAVKDQQLEEQHIRIEILESRTKDIRHQAAHVKELEVELETHRAATEAARKHGDKIEEEREALQRQIDKDRTELETLRRMQLPDGGSADIPIINQSVALAMEQQLISLKLEIDSLQAAIRYLRDENIRLQLPVTVADMSAYNHAWLTAPLPRSRPYKAREQTTAVVVRESQALFDRLLIGTNHFAPVDLRKTLDRPSSGHQPAPKTSKDPTQSSRLSTWRPVKSTPRYHILQQKEELQHWNSIAQDLILREKGFGRRRAAAPRAGDDQKDDRAHHIHQPSSGVNKGARNSEVFEDAVEAVGDSL